jgi:hypothetical protein
MHNQTTSLSGRDLSCFLGWGFAEFRKMVSMLVTHFCRDLSCDDDRYDQH